MNGFSANKTTFLPDFRPLLVATPTLQASKQTRETMVFNAASMLQPCQQNSVLVMTFSPTELRLSNTFSVFGFVAHPEGSWQVLAVRKVRYSSVSCSPANARVKKRLVHPRRSGEIVLTWFHHLSPRVRMRKYDLSSIRSEKFSCFLDQVYLF